MELFLVRHGETTANAQRVYQGWSDLPLTDKGREEARNLQKLLKDEEIRTIYCSPLLRAVETAAIIGEGLSRPTSVIITEALKEMHFGNWEGLSAEEIIRQNPVAYQHWLDNWQETQVPGGESAKQMYQRIESWIQQLLESEPDGAKLCLVTHQGVILQLIAHLLGMGLDGCWHFQVKPGSLSVVQIHDQFAVLTRLNQR